MKIEEEYTSFTGQVHVGAMARFIKISNIGYEVLIKDLIERTQHFSRIVLFGNPFYDKIEVPKLIKQTLKYSPNVIFDIHCMSNIRPIGIGKFDNVNYYVNIPLKKEGGTFEDRVNMTTMGWFIDVGAKVVFDIYSENDVDEVITMVSMIGIPKRLVYLSPGSAEQLNETMTYCVKYKFNFAPNFRKFLWDDFGRDKIKE
jgi:hypothetical protein